MNGTGKRLLMLCAVALAVSGCATAPARLPAVPENRDATLALIRHPQFDEAVKAAPRWVSDALLQITAYEAQLARRDQ